LRYYDILGGWLVALANTDGGRVIIGVEDDDNVCGAVCRSIMKACNGIRMRSRWQRAIMQA